MSDFCVSCGHKVVERDVRYRVRKRFYHLRDDLAVSTLCDCGCYVPGLEKKK